MSLSRSQKQALYRSMLRIRRAEEAMADRYGQEQMRCPTHLCIGHEAVATGVCEALQSTDRVFSNHRAHGHYLAKGGDLKGLIAEIYGRRTGCSGGMGGSMHLIDPEVGFMGSTPIVGGTVPLAVGAAWSAKIQNQDHVGVAFFGDGCFEEGVVHECLNFAALHKLPVLFVCENNDLSVFTPLSERQPQRPLHAVAAAQGWNTWVADGDDVCVIYDQARRAVAAARAGEGPQFLEYRLYRWLEHCGPLDDDHLGYRDLAEKETWLKRCPVKKLREELLADGVGEKELESTDQKICSEISDAFEFALKSPYPDPSSMGAYLYADA